MKIKLSDHFTYNRLLRFTLPSVVMMVVASIYSVVDGLFVSNLVGDLALSAVNIIFPVTMIIGAFGFMLGTGGSAIVARTLGEGRKELAQEYFSMLIYTVLVVGGILSVVSVVLTEPIARLAGASDLLIDDCVAYGRIMLAGSVVFMLQVLFQSFFGGGRAASAGAVFLGSCGRDQHGTGLCVHRPDGSGHRRGRPGHGGGLLCGRRDSSDLLSHRGALRPALR